MTSHHEFTYIHADEQDREYKWLIEFTYTPGEPAEIEITSITEQGIDISGRAFSSDLNNKLEAAAWEYLDHLSQNADPT